MKNQIIEKVVMSLMKNRDNLNYELVNLNHNETSFNEKKMTLEIAISNVDMQVSSHLMNLEITKTNNR